MSFFDPAPTALAPEFKANDFRSDLKVDVNLPITPTQQQYKPTNPSSSVLGKNFTSVGNSVLDATSKSSPLAVVGYIVRTVFPPLSATLLGYGIGLFIGRLALNLSENICDWNPTEYSATIAKWKEKIKNFKLDVVNFNEKYPYAKLIAFIANVAIAAYVSLLLAFGLAVISSALTGGLIIQAETNKKKLEQDRKSRQDEAAVVV